MSQGNWKRVVFALIMIVLLALGGVVQAAGHSATYVEEWDGRGTDSLDCGKLGEGERTEEGWIHWVFSTKGASTDAELVLGGTGSGTYEPGEPLNANVWHFFTPFFELEGLEATIYLFGGDAGTGGGLVISDYCPGYEELTVTKTAETSWMREHFWDIDKSVDTDNGYMLNGYPKIWLDGPGDEGDEWATWTIDVTYEGYEDSGFNVSGEITIENTGSLAAVITSVDDVLGGSAIDVDCGVTFPYTLAVGETLVCTYSEDVASKIEGKNVVTVTTERDAYSAKAYIVWGDPTTVKNETVNIKDISDLFGEVWLGMVTAPDGDTFTYDKGFAWVDYEDECGESFRYDNTAEIFETGQWAKAILKVNVRCEILDVEKTAVTSFEREYFWDIDKMVETENEHMLNGTPKIWLYTDSSGDEKATWTIDVSYEGYEDSAFNVSGVITVTNTGQLDAVITRIEDLLAGEAIDIDCGEIEFPFTLAVGETLVCTYSEGVASKIEGYNVVTVTTERDTYSAQAEVIWGDPTTEINKTVNIKDISDLFGEVDLGTVTAPNGDSFTYYKNFAFEGFDECGAFLYENRAMIVETNQDADASLKVNVQCVYYESAWAKADKNDYAFCDNGFSNWGWSNRILPGTYTWDLWAGAGQCDTSKGTLVGSVTVVYDGTNVVVTFNVNPGVTLGSTAVYAGTNMFPKLRNGRNTVAPGQYSIMGPFSGQEIYVIAHANVGVPDPDFGP